MDIKASSCHACLNMRYPQVWIAYLVEGLKPTKVESSTSLYNIGLQERLELCTMTAGYKKFSSLTE